MGKLGLFEFAQMRVFHLDAADLKIKGSILCDRLKLSKLIHNPAGHLRQAKQDNLGYDEFFNSDQGGDSFQLSFRYLIIFHARFRH